MADERPGGILPKAPGKGTGRGKAGDVESKLLRGKCKVALRNTEKAERVLRTDTAKNEHHRRKLRKSTAESGTFGLGEPTDLSPQALQGKASRADLHLGHLRGLCPVKSPPLIKSTLPAEAPLYMLPTCGAELLVESLFMHPLGLSLLVSSGTSACAAEIPPFPAPPYSLLMGWQAEALQLAWQFLPSCLPTPPGPSSKRGRLRSTVVVLEVQKAWRFGQGSWLFPETSVKVAPPSTSA